MADNTDIEWARHPVTGRGASWNPILAKRLSNGKIGYHCEHVTPGCEFCYAETFNRRTLPNRGTGLPFKPGHRADVEIFADAKTLGEPLRWRAPRGIFVCSMTDLFGDFVPDELIDQVFAVMALAPRHVFMVLTKRPERMRSYLTAADVTGRIAFKMGELAVSHGQKVVIAGMELTRSWDVDGWPLRNVWLGTSAEDQRRAEERIPDLLATPAAKRFISAEPLLGPLDLTSIDIAADGSELTHLDALTGLHMDADDAITGVLAQPDPRIDWVIAGFESGAQARVTEGAPDIARSLRDQCARADVPFFYKQWGNWIFAPDGMNYAEAIRWSETDHHGEPPFWKDSAWGRSHLYGPPSRFERFSDGRTAFYTSKKKAGRLLDGVEHSAMPGAD